jgi:hypothetical protein
VGILVVVVVVDAQIGWNHLSPVLSLISTNLTNQGKRSLAVRDLHYDTWVEFHALLGLALIGEYAIGTVPSFRLSVLAGRCSS